MKNKIGVLVLLGIIIVLPIKVSAAGFSVNISCPSTSSAGAQVQCTISATPSGVTLNGVSAHYNFSEEITYNGFTVSNNFSNYTPGSNLGFVLGNLNGFASTTTLGTLTVTLPSNATSNQTYTVGLRDIEASDTSYNSYNAGNVNASIRIRSNENRLSSLSISGGSINFNSNTLNYTTTINSNSAVISATKMDSNSTLTGNIGNVSLNYGTNIFRINVTSETGETRTYTINVTRPDNRSKNNNLSSLIVTNTDISFDKNKTTYNLTTTESETQISATKDDTKASVSGSLGKFNLNYGLNTFRINVTAEDGSVKTYTINITRQDVRSDNNYLKSLSISNGKINFSKNTTTYNVDVENDVESVTISATLDDNKASFVNGTGPRTVNLSLGNNTVYIQVQNEKGELRTYTLNINRKDGRDSDSTLKEINLSTGKIDFDPETLEYKVNVEYDVETFKIEAIPNVDKSKVTITGDENLKIGENIFTITVEAENGKKSEYKITVVRKNEGEKLSTNNFIKSLTIKNHSIDFAKNVYRYTVKTKEDELNLSIVLDDETAEYKITGNENLKDGSKITIKVTAENGDIRTYIIDIEKSNNILIIMIIILLTLITAGIVTIILLKRKKKISNIDKVLSKKQEDKLNNFQGKNYEEVKNDREVKSDDEDFTSLE